MRTLTLPLAIVEPSEPAAGAILVVDQDNNDIAEFYHCEQAIVGQTYAEALQLAQALVAAFGSRNVSGNENGKEPPVFGKEIPKRRLAPKASVTDEQVLALIDAVQSMPRSSPKTTGVGSANMPLFIGMQADPDGAWVHWYDIVKELRRMIEQNPQAAIAKAECR